MTNSDNIVYYKLDNLIANVVINNEKQLNSLNKNILQKLLDILSHLNNLDSSLCRLIVISSVGEKSFIAGADIKFMKEAGTSEISDFIKLGHSVMNLISSLNVPVLALVEGFALGGGLELALACDLIISTSNSRFGLVETNLGLIPGFGGTQRLAMKIGIAKAKKLIYLAETITAEEAHNIGLIDYLFTQETKSEQLQQITNSLLSKSYHSLLFAKKSLNSFYENTLTANLESEILNFLNVFKTNDAIEGIDAFISKRKPSFIGK
ncbi:MAG: enoyl-CoA hydratase/isomerase family protein [Proteobacteria bacterium]|nr:enoyl-CoA hydratase/isomerase family protein [Pseudomonadota bacterium]